MSREPRDCLAFRDFRDLGDHLARLERKVPRGLQGPKEPQDLWDLLVPASPGLRATMGRKDRLDLQEPKGHQVKRDLEERRVNQESAPVLLGESPSSLACRVPQVSLDHQVLPECLDCRECQDTTVCQDSLGSLPSWDLYPLSSTSSRASVETVPRARQPIPPSSWRREKRETRASPGCQASTTAPGASQEGSAHERRRPGETTVRENLAVLGTPACLVLQGCQAREEKRVHLACAALQVLQALLAPQVFLVLLAPPDCLAFKESEGSRA